MHLTIKMVNSIIINLDSITVNRLPTLAEESSTKKDIADEPNKNAILRLNQTLQNFLRVSVGSDVCNLHKKDRIQITDTTIVKYPNQRGYLSQQWNVKRSQKMFWNNTEL